MMKRLYAFLILAALATTMVQTASAGNENDGKKPHVAGFTQNKFWDNWEIQVGAGPNFTLKTNSDCSDIVNVSIYGAALKWFHPVFGVRLTLEGGWVSYGLNSPFGLASKQTYSYIFGHPDFFINLSNWIGGYKERVYNADIYAGMGLGSMNVTASDRTLCYLADIGFQNRFNLGKKKSVSIDLTVQYQIGKRLYFPDQDVAANHYHGIEVFAGLTYRFNRRTFGPAGVTEDEAKALMDRAARASKSVSDANARKDALTAAIAAAEAEAAARAAAKAAKPAPAPVVEKPVEKVPDVIETPFFFKYANGVTSLSMSDRSRLDVIARKLRNDKSSRVYNIEGYADSKTGSPATNEKYAAKRAQIVYDYLIHHGVSKEKVSFKGCGTTDFPFSIENENRVTVIY